jgi:hypothetical protein
MKNDIIIFLALLFLVSCTNVYLEFPQPTYLKDLDRIPSNFQGNFETSSGGFFAEKKVDVYQISDEYCLINSDTLWVGSEELKVKHQGNNLYVNLKEDSLYALYVLSRHNYFGSDSLIIKTMLLFDPEDNQKGIFHYKNIGDYLMRNNIDFENMGDNDILIKDSLSVNEINTLLNYIPPLDQHYRFNK